MPGSCADAVTPRALAAVESSLTRALAPAPGVPAPLQGAMEDAVFPGGKRWRPALVLSAAELCGGSWQEAVGSAAATELIHCASLAFDDLPCMDDALTRRGRAALHVRHGEALAVLAGLGLLTAAYDLLAREGGRERRAVRAAARHVGRGGMLGGQVVDLDDAGPDASTAAATRLSYRKTSALVVLSVQLGALHGSPDRRQWRKLTRFGREIGEAFQAADDLCDGDGVWTGAAASARVGWGVRAAVQALEEGFEPCRARDTLVELASSLAARAVDPSAVPALAPV